MQQPVLVGRGGRVLPLELRGAVEMDAFGSQVHENTCMLSGVHCDRTTRSIAENSFGCHFDEIIGTSADN